MTAAAVRMRRSWSRAEEPEWLVWALVVVLLAIGLLARTVVLTQMTTFSDGGVTVKYPAGWVALEKQDEREVLAAGEPFETTLFPARMSLFQLPSTSINTNAASLGDLALQWSDRGSRDMLAYKVLNLEPVKVRDHDAVRVDYVYVTEPALPAPNSIPVVAHGSDFLIRQGDVVTVARFVAASDQFDGLTSTWDRILASLELK